MAEINFDEYEVTASHNSDLLTQDLIFQGILNGARFSDFGLSFDYPLMYYDHRTGDIGWNKKQVTEIRETLLTLEQYDQLIKLLDNNLSEYKLFLKRFSNELMLAKDTSEVIKEFFTHSIMVTKAIALHIFEYGLSNYLEKHGVKLESLNSYTTETAKAMSLLKNISVKFNSKLILFKEGGSLDLELKKALISFIDEFGYLGMIYFKGSPWTLWDVIEMVNNSINLPEGKQGSDNNLDNKYVYYLEQLIRLRTESWEVMCRACYLFRTMVKDNFSEIINYNNLLEMRISEVIDVLSGKFVDKVEVSSRKYFLLQLTKDGLEISKVTKKSISEKNNLCVEKIVKGQIAHLGKVVGKAKVVLSPKECDKVDVGDIIIAKMSTPDYLPAMVKAAAFVTDVGGITSHASIVSREMKKPCIIGTKIATHIFNDGDLIEVDANTGVVRIIK
ncbi:hypothetical protein COY27_06025 [Candidatus Woesearchaeota archaeon CG_4_10_14_0_2_um_filter_33_13]|nr:MAG: hypothetical protein COY27_06025 [Candidatus Woesearchaeota archaeon CG_4_10_14_0_2_um_filter_33_13]